MVDVGQRLFSVGLVRCMNIYSGVHSYHLVMVVVLHPLFDFRLSPVGNVSLWRESFAYLSRGTQPHLLEQHSVVLPRYPNLPQRDLPYPVLHLLVAELHGLVEQLCWLSDLVGLAANSSSPLQDGMLSATGMDAIGSYLDEGHSLHPVGEERVVPPLPRLEEEPLDHYEVALQENSRHGNGDPRRLSRVLVWLREDHWHCCYHLGSYYLLWFADQRGES